MLGAGGVGGLGLGGRVWHQLGSTDVKLGQLGSTASGVEGASKGVSCCRDSSAGREGGRGGLVELKEEAGRGAKEEGWTGVMKVF